MGGAYGVRRSNKYDGVPEKRILGVSVASLYIYRKPMKLLKEEISKDDFWLF